MDGLLVNRKPVRGVVEIAPVSVAVDATNIAAALARTAAAGQILRLLPGTYRVATPITVPNYARLEAGPGVTIVSTIAAGAPGSIDNAVFQRNPRNTEIVRTTLASQNTEGTKTLVVVDATGLAIGDWIALRGMYDASNEDGQVAIYQIANLVGTTITTERLVLRTYKAGSIVNECLPNIESELIGNGALITGTGDRAFNLPMAYRCKVASWKMDGSWTDHQASFDLGGYACVFEDMYVDANGSGAHAAGIAMESMEAGTIRHCTVTGSVGTGAIHLPLCQNVEVINCRSYNNTNGGLILATNGGTYETVGSRGCRVIGGEFVGNAFGIQVSTGAADNTIQGATIAHNTSGGILCAGTGTVSTRTSIIGCLVSNNAYGITFNASKDNVVSDCITRDNTNNSINTSAAASVLISNLVCSELTATPVSVAGAGDIVRMLGGRLETRKVGYTSIFNVTEAADVWISNVRMTCSVAPQNGTPVQIANKAAVVHLENVTCTFGNVGVYALGTSPTIWQGPGCSYNAADILTGAHINRGTATLNGASPAVIAVAFRGITAKSQVHLTLITKGGTGTGLAPTVTINTGTGFTLTSVNGDTSVWAYEVTQ